MFGICTSAIRQYFFTHDDQIRLSGGKCIWTPKGATVHIEDFGPFCFLLISFNFLPATPGELVAG